MRIALLLSCCVIVLPCWAASRSSGAQEAALFPRQEINAKRTGLNAFANEPIFGSVRNQLREVRSTLRIKYVRVLFAWNDQVQPTPQSDPDFSFYDQIAGSLPLRTRALVVMTGLPSWMTDSSNWIESDPRKTFNKLWLEKVVTRYKRKRRIAAWEIWNEPDMSDNPDNVTLQLSDSPQNYLALLEGAAAAIERITPRKLIVSAATRSINQDYPNTLNYNVALKEGGLEELADVVGVHYYGKQYEKLLLGGISDYLNSLVKPIWITESGEQGNTEQLAYVEEVWTLLQQSVPKISRFYYYQFTESGTPAESYGLKSGNSSSSVTTSDLYQYLKNR